MTQTRSPDPDHATAERSVTGGYSLVVAAPWLPVNAGPPRWPDGVGDPCRALRTTIADRAGAWVGASVVRPGEVALLDNVWLHPVALDPGTGEDYLHGHCQSTLAPLYHDNGAAPVFERRWRLAYKQVNRLVAARVATVAAPQATVWVNDYHLQLVPGYLHAARPDLRIGFFLHSPFPSAERFATQPLRDDIVSSLCAADLVGLQDSRSLTNVTDVIESTRQPAARSPMVGIFPTSIDVGKIEKLTQSTQVRRSAASIRKSLGHPPTVLLSVGGPDQGDSSHRLLNAYAELLGDGRVDPDRSTLVHVAVCGDDPTHLRCDRQRLDRAVARINGTHGRVGRPAVHYLHRRLSLHDAVALYLAADVMLALPLREGMTLAAKEYIAARTDNTGRLVLSEFSGAATDLTRADLVNPYDIDAVEAAIVDAIAGCHAVTGDVAAMRHHLTRNDAATWIDQFLGALSGCPVRASDSIWDYR